MPKLLVRSQNETDEVRETIGQATGIDCSADPMITRQEERELADVNQIMKRFNYTGLLPAGMTNRHPVFGDNDMDLDLQQALNAAAATSAAFDRLPQAVRDKYPTWLKVLSAVESKELNEDLTFPKTEITPTTPTT